MSNINDTVENSSKRKKIEITSIHKNHRKRMREKILKYGFDGFSEHEVLECLLYYSIPIRDTNEIAHNLIDKFGSIRSVLTADFDDLKKVDGISEVSASLIILFRELNKYINVNHYDKTVMRTSRVAGEFCCEYFRYHKEENFIVISLNAKQGIKCIDVISRGTEYETAVYRDKILKAALNAKSSLIILAHNHPGGNATPSANDIEVTKSLCKALAAVNITIMDHIVCNGYEYVSMSDRNMFR